MKKLVILALVLSAMVPVEAGIAMRAYRHMVTTSHLIRSPSPKHYSDRRAKPAKVNEQTEATTVCQRSRIRYCRVQGKKSKLTGFKRNWVRFVDIMLRRYDPSEWYEYTLLYYY